MVVQPSSCNLVNNNTSQLRSQNIWHHQDLSDKGAQCGSILFLCPLLCPIQLTSYYQVKIYTITSSFKFALVFFCTFVAKEERNNYGTSISRAWKEYLCYTLAWPRVFQFTAFFAAFTAHLSCENDFWIDCFHTKSFHCYMHHFQISECINVGNKSYSSEQFADQPT